MLLNSPYALQEQKQKQREKEYEKKRDQKARDRQMYYMRHTRDYETLELPVGASRADVKAAYRKLAKVRHQRAILHVKGPSDGRKMLYK